jgi:lipopolysaccharide biosynthesis protein
VADVPIGFFPKEYISLHPDLEVWRDQPMRCLVHYLEHGRAEGRQIGYWQLKTDNLELEIPTHETPLPAAASSPESRICILVHVYYPEIWPELASFVRNLQVAPADVFINVTDSQWTPKLHRELRELCPEAFVQLSPNRGRDIGGHLRLLDNVHIERYDTFALMHTKKSRHLPEATATGWRKGLIAPFAGNPAVASRCLKLFSEQPKTGMVAAAAWRAHSMNGNQIEVDRLMRRYGIEPRNRRLDFVSGTMFLIRSEIVARFHRELRETAWEDATGKDPAFFMDGQLEHAIERVIPSLARQMGYEIVWC